MLKSKFFKYGVGGVATPIIGVITIPLLSWFFSPNQLGEMNLFIVLITGISLVFSFGLDQALIRDYNSQNSTFLLLEILVFVSFFLLVLFFLASIFKKYLECDFKLFYFDNLLEIISGAFFILIIRFNMVIMRMEGHALSFSFTQIVRKFSVLTILFISVLLHVSQLGFPLLEPIYLQLTSVFITALFSFFFVRSKFKGFKYKRSYNLKKSLTFGWPLTISGFLFWGLTSSDRILITFFNGVSELGVYSLALSFSAVVTVIQAVFSTIWVPVVYKWYQGNAESNFFYYTQKLVLLFLVLLFFLILMFSPLIEYLIPESYHGSLDVLAFVVFHPVFYMLSEVTGVGVNISRKTKLMIPIVLLSIFINLLLLFLLLDELGIVGAGISLAVAFFIYFLMKSMVSGYVTENKVGGSLHTYVISSLLLLVSFIYVYHDYILSLLLCFIVLCYTAYDFFMQPKLKEFIYEWKREV
ncbi:lipopolysaccharide biosynthesis protein [Pseudoalteromonas sp.]|uniref:lipopolysaccharide biosynthesis protein n=1 Tax=Pseudoalteromonas sp. TaxID=53249 RepID=UPI003519524A